MKKDGSRDATHGGGAHECTAIHFGHADFPPLSLFSDDEPRPKERQVTRLLKRR
jgi:hypothetical protein